MSNRDLAYKKELLLLKGEMLRLRLRHEMNQHKAPLTLASSVGRLLANGGKERLLITALTTVIPSKRLRTVLRTTLRTVLIWRIARKLWSQR